ncbi:hypothetical protein GAPWKB30_0792 [Gilliamella apicola]|nr:hypothetical protein GAPWKB30_0792 [Gilliamella apicola]
MPLSQYRLQQQNYLGDIAFAIADNELLVERYPPAIELAN